jgi:hypothetical protein
MNSQWGMTESEIFNNLISKIRHIETNLTNIYSHTLNTDSQKNINYLEKLNELSIMINNLTAISDDMYDEYVMGLPQDSLSNEEKQKRETIINNKKIYNTFAPYMLYMGIMLQNQNQNPTPQ